MKKIKILVVEDEFIIAMEIQDRLENLGYEVIDLVPSGEEAIELIAEEEPDLVLMDIILRGKIDGVEAVREIRKRHDIPIIYLTANADENTFQRAKITEPSGYILKPVEEHELQIAIEIALYKSQMQKKVGNRKATTFFEREEELVERFTQLSSMALNNTRLYRQLQQELVEQQRVEEALRLSEERYALAASAANNGLWDWDLQSDEIYFCDQWKAMIGYQDEDFSRARDWFNRVHPDDLEQLQMNLAAIIKGAAEHFENEHRMWHKDGTYCWMLSRGVAVRNERGDVCRMVGTQTDVTNRKETEEQLLHEAFHDPLTGLPNRALFTNRLMRAISKGRQLENYRFALLFLDLDRFKLINDSLGHLAGDELLVGIAQRLKECVRSGDTVARLGGDEFTILLEDMKEMNHATIVAERIQETLTHPFNICGQEIFASTSIGIVLGDSRYEGPEDLLRDADTAMYQAKARGKARYELFDLKMHHEAVASLQLETELRQAIQREEFRLHYLPIVSLDNAQIVGLEALARWQHPSRGLLLPAEFISAAEETGLIIPLGEWVLRTGCTQLARWQSQFPAYLQASPSTLRQAQGGPGSGHRPSAGSGHRGSPSLTMSVNFSFKQLMQSNLVEQIPHILWETGLTAQDLKIEIPESAITEQADAFAARLRELHALGVDLQLDDFSTRYFEYLHHFPITTVKIDPSVIHHIGQPGKQADIIYSIITLAHRLGMKVIAEGVESAQQVALLRDLKCDYAQGYFFSEPLNSQATEALLAKQWSRQ